MKVERSAYDSSNPTASLWSALYRAGRMGLVLLCGLAAAVGADGACLPSPAGLVGWWPGDGDAGDIAGANHGVLLGGATASAAGMVSSAFNFDGTNAYVEIPDSPALRPTNLTIEAWVRFNSLDSAGNAPAGEQYLVLKQNSRTSGFEGYNLAKLRVAGGDVLAFMVSPAAGQGVVLQSSTLVTTGVWYHVAGVRDTNTVQLYVNGQLERQTGVNFPQDYGNYPLVLGSSGQAYWDRKLNGSLDEVSLYNRALASSEVAAIYSAGAAGKCKVPVGPSITAQPQSQTIAAGNSVSLSVTAYGTAPLRYQWLKNGKPLAEGGNVSGTTNANLTLLRLQANDGGAYQVAVSNAAGSVTSTAANLIVVSPVYPATPSTPQGAGAIVLVNSTSAKYPDFQHYIQSYLDNFGVPYAVLDIASNSVVGDLSRYALILIGHGQLDPNGATLGSTGQAAISLAVSNGTGLVSFDGVLTPGGGNQFAQNIFRFGNVPAVTATSVSFPATQPAGQMHYITALHTAGESIGLRSSMSLAGLTVPTNVTAVAVSGGQPLLAIARYGQGRAAQWTSYDWMSTTVLGPVDGLDDLVWRSLVWAARKPFVMRGMPNFLTMRVDDVSGPFWYVHIANEMGFKPWLGLFLSDVAETNTADLRSLVTSGNATASIHSLDSSQTFFYFDHSTGKPWPDNVIADHFNTGTQWHISHGIPVSKVVVAHYSEIGPNAFAGLKSWGVQFVSIIFSPGSYWSNSPPWLAAGPYRRYEPPGPGTSSQYPISYADFLSIPGHPEFDGEFFCCATEIKDDASCGEWCPDNNDISGSIGRGTRQIKRAFDSLIHASLLTHEWYLQPIPEWGVHPPSITTDNFRAMLQGITNNLAAYKPIFVTHDYAAQYMRATRTARLVGADYDPASGRVTTTLVGVADVDLQVSVFSGEDSSISSTPTKIPAFLGSTTNLLTTPWSPRLTLSMTPSRALVISWPSSSSAGFTLQQNAGFQASEWVPVTNSPVVAGDQLQVVIPNPINGRFYRLDKP